MSSVEKKNYFLDTTKMLYLFFIAFLKIGSVLGSAFFAKEYQGIPKTKIKNVDLTTFYQEMRKNAKE